VVAVVAIVVLEILQDTLLQGESLGSHPFISAIVSLTHNAVNTVRSWGYWGVFGLMLLESSSLPIPSEVILPFAGYLVASGQLDFWVTVALATLAGVLGSLIDYYIGYKGVRYLSAHRFLGKVFFTKSQLQIAANWFGKYGAATVFLGRLVPGFRTIASFPAGAVRMPLRRFVVYTTAGCFIWNALLIYVGVFLGARWREVAGVSHYVITAAAAAGVVVLVVWLVRRRRRRKAA
jgi:membrane protein DedA with SNARE-associated domain